MVVYYNTNFIPKQDYRITSVLKQNCGYDSKTMIEHALQPWKPLTPKQESIFLIKGDDYKTFIDSKSYSNLEVVSIRGIDNILKTDE